MAEWLNQKNSQHKQQQGSRYAGRESVESLNGMEDSHEPLKPNNRKNGKQGGSQGAREELGAGLERAASSRPAGNEKIYEVRALSAKMVPWFPLERAF